jgi:murein DD-endopeptidase MepM/ murein hydrolase activator NlpD
LKKSIALALIASFMVTACSQPANNARYYQYGGILTAGSSLGLHTMRGGETLWTVAKAYNVDLRDMLDLNKLSAPYKTRVGDRIKIPAPANYTVRRSDTLYKVSRMFDTTTTELARLNNIKAPYKLGAGQTLRLPPRHAQPTAVAQVYTPAYSPVVATTSKTQKIEREELKPVQVTREEALISSPQPSIPQSNPDVGSSRLSPPVLSGSVNFIKPVTGKIISGYGPKEDGLHNDGINIKAAQGDAVRAAEQGIVVYQGNQIEGYGNMILIRHANGYLTAYAHMAKTLVHKGDKVKRGQTIGTVGASGNVKTPQLHFEIRKGRDAIDPKTLIQI